MCIRRQLSTYPFCLSFYAGARRSDSCCCAETIPGRFNRPGHCRAERLRAKGARVGTVSAKSEADLPNVRMLRTAMGATITLEDLAVVVVMLNPDGRLWIDRLAKGL